MRQVLAVHDAAPPHWVGDGFPVHTFFAYDEPVPFSPFLLLDYAAPATFPAATRPRGVGPHPHRGFETVTIVYAGEVAHRDSAGNGGTIGPGDVQWMTAASGLVHEEFHSADFTKRGGEMEMVQLWVNLPARDKKHAPRYQDLRTQQIPVVELPHGGGTARVIAGECQGSRGPARTFTPIELWDVTLRADRPTRFVVPKGHTTLLLVQRGTVQVPGGQVAGSVALAPMELAMFERDGDTIELEAKGGDARALLLAGAPIDEPVFGHGPFVMNTQAEIRQAIDDFQNGRMGALES
jgi:redox-sensitive bicupin YhaK (pirin superfamily)